MTYFVYAYIAVTDLGLRILILGVQYFKSNIDKFEI